ncbi:MAG: CCA tRNA nucleotidyltransferase [Parcubacteria group bacterium]|nr:CCA tRNA nucleotidyltransferase [Parcubacteria group bacterium]
MQEKIPQEVKKIIDIFRVKGFQAFIVGGCVRDLLMGLKPKDWDITTDARPEKIQEIFPDSFYENEFGTVGIKTGSDDASVSEVQATTFRIEEKYKDKRHPDVVIFADKLEEDLARRDFTINAMAFDVKEGKLVDSFGGEKDLKNKLIRTVGNPEERFSEDALRLLRAIRFATTLSFELDNKTKEAIVHNASWLSVIAEERIRDELLKVIEYTPNEWIKTSEKSKKHSSELTDKEYWQSPARAFELMREVGLLKYILPELEEGYGVTQNKHHTFTVWEHNLKAFAYAVKENFNWHVRLGALLHDVAKPRTKKGEGLDSTYYGHDVVGAKMTAQITTRLHFSKKDIERVTNLVRYHLFQSDPDKITDSAVRRVVRNVSSDYIWDLINVRLCDRIGSGVPKAEPYRLRKFLVMLEKALREPISLKQLKINGGKIMEILKLLPGPRVGWILNSLMNEVIDDSEKNNLTWLEQRAGELNELSNEELERFSKEAKEKMEQVEYKKEEETKKKYWIT